jgi:hypothetical protein
MKLKDALEKIENNLSDGAILTEEFAPVYEAAKDFQTIIDAREKATSGEWEYLNWKEQKERGVGFYPNDQELPIFTADGETVMGFGNTETYYNSAGEEPSVQDADFITTAANITSKYIGGEDD